MWYFIAAFGGVITGLFIAGLLAWISEQERLMEDETAQFEQMPRDMGEGEMDCPACGNEMSLHDTTYSNVSTKRAEIGQHTGDIYYCERCKEFWLDDFLSGEIYQWRG